MHQPNQPFCSISLLNKFNFCKLSKTSSCSPNIVYDENRIRCRCPIHNDLDAFCNLTFRRVEFQSTFENCRVSISEIILAKHSHSASEIASHSIFHVRSNPACDKLKSYEKYKTSIKILYFI